jgi:hypothetical protein
MLTEMLTIGLAAAGLAALIRVAVTARAWAARKPWNCPACMAGWCSAFLFMLAAAAHLGIRDSVPLHDGPSIARAVVVVGVTWLGATGLATFLLAQTGLFAPDPLGGA